MKKKNEIKKKMNGQVGEGRAHNDKIMIKLVIQLY